MRLRPHRIAVVEAMLDMGLVAGLCDGGSPVGPDEVLAAWAGGARLVELRHTGRSSIEQFKGVREAVRERGPFVGVSGLAGSTAVREYLELGADFVSAPLDGDVARNCHQAQAAYFPEVGDTDAIREALGMGTDIVITDGDVPDSDATYFVRLSSAADRDDVIRCVELGARGVVVPVDPVEPVGATLDALPVSRWIRAALGEPLFGPVEHIGLYPSAGDDADAVTGWYQSTFGFGATRAKTTYVGSGILGRIEVMPGPAGEAPHVAISVRDLDEAISYLTARGHPVRDPVATANAKLAYLEERDPSGCLVHLIWRPRRFAS